MPKIETVEDASPELIEQNRQKTAEAAVVEREAAIRAALLDTVLFEAALVRPKIAEAVRALAVAIVQDSYDYQAEKDAGVSLAAYEDVDVDSPIGQARARIVRALKLVLGPADAAAMLRDPDVRRICEDLAVWIVNNSPDTAALDAALQAAVVGFTNHDRARLGSARGDVAGLLKTYLLDDVIRLKRA